MDASQVVLDPFVAMDVTNDVTNDTTTARKNTTTALHYPVALYIEFQEYLVEGAAKWGHRLGRVAMVNTEGETIIDVYAAYPREDQVQKKMPPSMFGVTKKDLLLKNGAVPAEVVEEQRIAILKDRTVVMHGGRLDCKAFYLYGDAYKESTIMDTQDMYSHLGSRHGPPGLARCADEILGTNIQNGFHSPVEDAFATLQLYLLKRPYDRTAAFEAHQASLSPTIREYSNKLVLTTAAFARPNLETHDYRGKGVAKGKKVDNIKNTWVTEIKPFALGDGDDFPALGAVPVGRKKRG